MSVTIFHNPRCSKSRQTLELLKSNGVEPNVVEYLKQPPTSDALTIIINKLGVNVRDIIRHKEAEYKEVGADNKDLTDAELIALLVATPKLIERPIVVNGEKAVVGRPPENVLDII
ncbi:arsenate reductase (glutaredoxin) [Psychrosphaera aestuarii]|uniref:arsenate reductase (glutaredoxin) n=1 Tax=Psychrosphaera aestuarii TaxID=1266052 RepID=UPI001B333F57|nr:arsenate reductase (glutaredoxin) [Psychrosphaera aestuarii]